MKKLISALLAVLLLAAPVLAADEPDTLAARFDALRAEYHLDETNFAVSYYNTVTGEEYNWNETAMFTAASTFKLPLNLYYYELQNEGKISGDTVLTEGGATLDRCHYLSLVESNNELSIAMLYRIGDFRTYKETMRRYFTMTDDEIDPKYYQDNYYCTRMMMDALKYLYAHADEFPEMLDYMEQSLPRDAYFLHDLADEVTIAHKYGSFEGAENDTGIFYTEQPFLLAVYTQSVGERIVALAADLAYDYNLEQTRLQRQAQNQAAADAAWAAAIEAQRARFAADQAASAEAQARIDAEKAAAEAKRLAAEQAGRAPCRRSGTGGREKLGRSGRRPRFCLRLVDDPGRPWHVCPRRRHCPALAPFRRPAQKEVYRKVCAEVIPRPKAPLRRGGDQQRTGRGKRYKKFTKKRPRGFSGSAVCAIMVCGFLRHSSEWLDYTEKEPIL